MIVIDTNLALALGVNSDKTPLALSIYKQDGDWVAPPIWESEARNALIGMVRAGKLGMKTANAAFALAAENIDTLSVSTNAVLRLAETYGLTAYDAEFAALAEWLECKLLSFDDNLLKVGLAIHPKDF